ncbi:DUF3048 domain-containing protein [Candidatus Uhrbacteria bacterium]|nr:DUF3048 domain-containing protein [Candidatus Uhrbacteria bacterium]
MDNWLKKIQAFQAKMQPFRWHIAGGAVLLVALSILLFWYVITGGTRVGHVDPKPVATSTIDVLAKLVTRRLDGVLVPAGDEAYPPRVVMIENHPDARPVSGLSSASVVIEAPVEGGITRFMALFDATTTIDEVGPVRSARPYFVDWANGFRASYFHVGGSPDALDLIKALPTFVDVNEFAHGNSFWRDSRRAAPHNAYTDKERMDAILGRKQATGTRAVEAWHFIDMASTTDRGDVKSIRIPYGGSFNTTWNFDAERGVYIRNQGAIAQKDRDGSPIEANNVIVIKTDQQVLDDIGRLRIRTTGSGEALAYRDGRKFIIRWRRAAGEPIRFEGTDGAEFLLTRGKTWIQVTTDDAIFAGL